VRVCFLEAVLRDRRNGTAGSLPIHEDELDARGFADVEVVAPLRLVDLREDQAVLMGVPSDVHRSSRHTPGRMWSVAFHEHPASPDGIVHPSRPNGHTNLAVYGRAISKLRAVRVRKLLTVPGLVQVLDDLEVALVAT